MKDGRSQEEPPSISEKGLRGLEPTVVSTLGLVHLAHAGLSTPGFPQMEMLLQVSGLAVFDLVCGA